MSPTVPADSSRLRSRASRTPPLPTITSTRQPTRSQAPRGDAGAGCWSVGPGSATTGGRSGGSAGGAGGAARVAVPTFPSDPAAKVTSQGPSPDRASGSHATVAPSVSPPETTEHETMVSPNDTDPPPGGRSTQESTDIEHT